MNHQSSAIAEVQSQVGKVAVASAQLRWPLVRLLRPRQWIKNGFVLAPLIFAGQYLDRQAVEESLGAMILFCIASSAAYIFNDLHDVNSDRLHPFKRRSRPLASGAISTRRAVAMLAALWGVLLLGLLVRPVAASGLAAYVILNLAYTLRLKYVPVVDLFCIALGFVLRVFVGALAVAVPLSSWMLITTLCLALYLASIKRRQELDANGNAGRTVLEVYSIRLLDRYAQLAALSAIVFYGLFVIEVRPQLVVTIPLVLFGLFRYWFIVEKLGGGESPTDALWGDSVLLSAVLLWIAVVAYTLRPLP